MSRTLKLVLTAAVVQMLLLAIAVAAWRWQALADAPTGRWLLGTFAAFFMPVWLAMGAWVEARKMARPGLTAAPDTRRYNEITLMAAAALSVGVQAWMAGSIVGFIPKDSIQIRAIEALTGVFFMVVGNFAAKTSPPTGPRAPDPAVWTRGMLRIGWAGVAAGLVILVAAITVDIDQMVWAIFGVTGLFATAVLLQQRAMRRKPA
jgi:hypothetical protein